MSVVATPASPVDVLSTLLDSPRRRAMPQTTPEAVISHWSCLVENLAVSPLAFYEHVEGALKRREIPATQNSRTEYKEAGLFSASRQYLHVRRESLVFDICASPFGTGFFFSWWFAEERQKLPAFVGAIIALAMFAFQGWLLLQAGIVMGFVVGAVLLVAVFAMANTMASGGDFDDNLIRDIPVFGFLYGALFKPSTYYRFDSLEMFQKAVHNAVLEVIDQMTAAKGLRALSDDERKPLMKRFYERQAA
jgi:hypothetical protein